MPVYEYSCDDCGHKFEEFQSFKDEPLKVCPVCSEESLRKLFGVPTLLFRGDGWTKPEN